MPETNENKAIIDFAEKHLGLEIKEVADPRVGGPEDKLPFAVVPSGRTLQSLKPLLDDYLPFPLRRKGRAALRTLESLIEHTNRFKNDASALFAEPNEDKPRLTSLIDYHLPGADGRARWGEHRGIYEFPLSEQWKAWNGIDSQQLDLTTFAEFLENNIEAVVDPSGLGGDSPTKLLADKLGVKLATPSAVIAASKGLAIHVKHDVQEARSLETGECTLNFTEAHEPKGGVKIPAAFAISIPVFRAGAPYYIAVRLRYRVNGPRVNWICSLYRTDVVFDAAFNEACTKAKTETGLPLFFGTPE